MSATPESDEHLAARGGPLNEVGGLPEPEADGDGEWPEVEPVAPIWEPGDPDPREEDEQAEDVSAGDAVPPPDSEPEGDSVSEPEADPESEPESDVEVEAYVREIPGGAGHGPARAYGYIAVAVALGAEAELTAGGTRSTSRNPLQVTVRADPETFAKVNDVYDEIAPVAEQTAAAKRDEARKSGRSIKSYEMSLLSRAILAGFPQGAASALRTPGTTRPAPFREATRARFTDDAAHRSAVALGRAWAARTIAQRQDAHSAA